MVCSFSKLSQESMLQGPYFIRDVRTRDRCRHETHGREPSGQLTGKLFPGWEAGLWDIMWNLNQK